MARVALLLLAAQDRPGQALRLPLLEPARHRGHVRVAHFLQRLGREERAHASGAIGDDGRVTVWKGALDLLLDVALGNVHSARKVALLPLARLADVDERRRATLADEVGFGRRDLFDLAAGLLEEVGVGLWHGVH